MLEYHIQKTFKSILEKLEFQLLPHATTPASERLKSGNTRRNYRRLTFGVILLVSVFNSERFKFNSSKLNLGRLLPRILYRQETPFWTMFLSKRYGFVTRLLLQYINRANTRTSGYLFRVCQATIEEKI